MMTWLINSMEVEIGRVPIFFCRLQKKFGTQSKKPSQTWGILHIFFEIKSQLHDQKQGSLNVTQYYSVLYNLWQELDLFYDSDWHCPEDVVKYKKMLKKELVRFHSRTRQGVRRGARSSTWEEPTPVLEGGLR